MSEVKEGSKAPDEPGAQADTVANVIIFEHAPGLLRFYWRTDRGAEKVIPAGELYAKYDWIAAVSQEPDPVKRRFPLQEIDPSQVDIYPKYKFFATIGYAWSQKHIFDDPTQFPEEPGIYRLRSGGEVVMINAARNIGAQLRQSFETLAGQVDEFDYRIIPDELERNREVRAMLDAFQETVGHPPTLQPDTGKG